MGPYTIHLSDRQALFIYWDSEGFPRARVHKIHAYAEKENNKMMFSDSTSMHILRERNNAPIPLYQAIALIGKKDWRMRPPAGVMEEIEVAAALEPSTGEMPKALEVIELSYKVDYQGWPGSTIPIQDYELEVIL